MVRKWRNRAHEIPVQKYICTNCGNTFEYDNFAIMNRVNHFCCQQCKIEFYYFWHEMSARQFNILQRLIDNNGRDILPHGVSIDAMIFKRKALLEILEYHANGLIEVRITERGRWWVSLKKGVICE